MKWFNGDRIRLVLVGLIAAIVVGTGRSAKAEFTFGTPTNLGPTINRGPTVNSFYEDSAPSISSDGLSLYFSSFRPGGFGSDDIWVTTRATTEDDWGTPVNLDQTVNSSSGDFCPNISADGLSLFFVSERPGGSGGWDLWVATRRTRSDN